MAWRYPASIIAARGVAYRVSIIAAMVARDRR
jgi:hypothetical protein